MIDLADDETVWLSCFHGDYISDGYRHSYYSTLSMHEN